MNLKTTFWLLILAALGGTVLWLGPALWTQLGFTSPSESPAGAGTLQALEEEITADKLTAIEVKHGDRVLKLERGANGEWNLPGKWPARQPEVQQLVQMIAGLRSRF